MALQDQLARPASPAYAAQFHHRTDIGKTGFAARHAQRIGEPVIVKVNGAAA